MSFTDQKRRLFLENDLNVRWGSGKDRGVLRCNLCWHRFVVGDGLRWLYANSTPDTAGNIFVCDECDGPDVMERYQAAVRVLQEEMRNAGEFHWPIASVAKLLRSTPPCKPAREA